MPEKKPKPYIPKKTTDFMDPDLILSQLEIKEGMQVADFGCGSGYLSLEAARQVGKKGMVYACDIQKPVLNALKSKIRLRGARNIKTIWANLEIVGSTEIPQDSIDLVILSNIFHQSKLHHKILEETKRVLEKGGKIVIIDWKTSGVPLGKTFITRVEKAVVKKETEKTGFKFVKEIKTDEYHYGLVFEK